MNIKLLKLTNFRNFEKKEFKFKRANIIIAPNGTGKTNLLEAIFLLSCGKSFKKALNRDLINWDQRFCRLEAIVDQDFEKLKIELTINLEEKTQQIKQLKINRAKKPLLNLIGHIKTVYFAPESLDLVFGSPNERRRFLDIIVSQNDIKYARNLAQLNLILKNRNALLKSIKDGYAKKDELLFWNHELVDLSSKIIKKRAELIDFLNSKVSGNYQDLSAKQDVFSLVYKSQVKNLDDIKKIKHELAEKVLSKIDLEIMFGKSLIGPQREDIGLMLNNKQMAHFSSRGEARTAVIALKLAELEYFKTINDQLPILLLDDPFSELDLSRSKMLLKKIKEFNQYFLTATDMEKIDESLAKEANIIKL